VLGLHALVREVLPVPALQRARRRARDEAVAERLHERLVLDEQRQQPAPRPASDSVLRSTPLYARLIETAATARSVLAPKLRPRWRLLPPGAGRPRGKSRGGAGRDGRRGHVRTFVEGAREPLSAPGRSRPTRACRTCRAHPLWSPTPAHSRRTPPRAARLRPGCAARTWTRCRARFPGARHRRAPQASSPCSHRGAR
jgi:hypothetical protein